MMKQIETPAKEAINVDKTRDAVVKAASVKATILPTPYKSAMKKNRRRIQ